MKLPNSLSFRLLSITLGWTVIALLLTGLLLSTYFRQNGHREFNRLLEAHAFNLMGAIDIDDSGTLNGEPNLGDPRFLEPGSGWYWSIATAAAPQNPLVHSPSISGESLQIVDLAEKPFDEQFRRLSENENPDGTTSLLLEAQLFVGDGDTLYQVLVAGNQSDIEAEVSKFNRTLLLFFTFFGIGTAIATYFVIKIGLKPLYGAAESLHDVREGKSDLLTGEYPSEIEPLVEEINQLIQANRSIVDRARTQVGNLAHALKTPLAVILNDSRSPTKKTNDIVIEQAEMMSSQIQSYLERARIAAQRNTVASRTEIAPVLERLTRVMRKLSPSIDFRVEQQEAKLQFKGEEQDLEETLGNLLENAARFASSRVEIKVEAVRKSSGKPKMVQITVADDGVGLSAEQRNQALKRGIRLDETQPGSGLGLSIVNDIVTEYGGSFELHDNDPKGLLAAIVLPCVVA